jgi:hypothetical protein
LRKTSIAGSTTHPRWNCVAITKTLFFRGFLRFSLATEKTSSHPGSDPLATSTDSVMTFLGAMKALPAF